MYAHPSPEGEAQGRRYAAALLAAAVVMLSLAGIMRPTPVTSAREQAREHHRRGLDRALATDLPGAFVELRSALQVDPTYLAALFDLGDLSVFGELLPPGERRALEAMGKQPDSPLAFCVAAFFAIGDNRPLARAPSPSTPCADMPAYEGFWFPRLRSDARLRFALAEYAAYPESPRVATWLLIATQDAADWKRSVKFGRELSGRSRHPLLRAVGYAMLVQGLYGSGRYAEARRVEAEVAQLVREFGTAVLIERNYLGYSAAFYAADPALLAHVDSMRDAFYEDEAAALGRMEPIRRLHEGISVGIYRESQGRIEDALPVLDWMISLSDSLELPAWQAEARLRRGRALVKIGRTEGAERDLLAARTYLPRSPLVEPVYEVQHNLLHLYEAQGRDAEARAAGNAFMAATAKARLNPVRMIAYYDMGWYLWRAGELDAARPLFEAMVATIDSLGDHHYYAGEYYESIGDLELAGHYYRRQSTIGQDRVRAVAGMVRVSEALGDTAAAIRWAKDHDGRVLSDYPENRPLLPGVLARSGRLDEAAANLRKARLGALRRGQRAAWGRLTLELGELEGRRGDYELSRALADSAAVAAASVGERETEVRSRALAAWALVRLDPAASADALGELGRMVVEGARLGLPEVEIETRTLEGEALTASGKLGAALGTLRRAADVVDSVTAGLHGDVNRAGYRAASSKVSDLALAAVARLAPDPAPLWLEWSARRKGDATRAATVRLDALEHALGPHGAAVDYVVLPDGVAALVVTDGRATLRLLAVPVDTLRRRISALYEGLSPRVGSMVDLSRSRFDESLAASLYQDLVGPLEPLLEGRTHVIVIPDGVLQLVPFDALVTDGGGGASTYLAQRYVLSTARSPVVAAHAHQGANGRSLLAVAGVTAPAGAADEVRAVAAAYGLDRSRVLLGSTATEAAVRDAVHTVGIVHIAAHAVPNDREPDFAYVSLTPAGDEDGRLHAYEALDWRLSGGLVVLSACETGVGRVLAGEGVMSLGRAFLRAGASGVVATRWPVGRPTVAFMQTFYAALAHGEPPADALYTAKRAFLRGRYSDPLYWAPFTLLTEGVRSEPSGTATAPGRAKRER